MTAPMTPLTQPRRNSESHIVACAIEGWSDAALALGRQMLVLNRIWFQRYFRVVPLMQLLLLGLPMLKW